MAKELSEEEKEARRERKRAADRAYREANRERRKAKCRAYYTAHRDEIKEKLRARYAARCRQFRCRECGEHLAFNVRMAGKTICPACAKRQREATAAHRAAALRAELEAHGTPVCPRCGGRNIARLPRAKPGRRFYCRDCRKARRQQEPRVEVAPRPGGNPYPCPYCLAGRCRKRGYSRSTGRQQFVCRACGRGNTLLKPAAPKPAGPLRHGFTLVVGLKDGRHLEAICAARGWREATAVREILRKYAVPPSAVAARPARGRAESAGAPPLTPTPPLRFTEAALRDARPENLRRQWAHKREIGLCGRRLHRRVGMVRGLKVRLDDAAWEGLHRMMEATGMSHQDAARWMILQEPARPYVPGPPPEPEDRRGLAADLERRLGPAAPR